MRRVLVTGGAGFIGSHLCEALIQRGDDVFMIDYLSTGSYNNIRGLKDNSTFHITIGSILDLALLAPLVEKVDLVYHLAAAVGVPRSSRRLSIRLRRTFGSHNVLSACAKFHKTVVLASTSEVYERATCAPFVRKMTLSTVPLQKADGAMRVRRRSMNFWLWPMRKKKVCP